MGLFRTLLIVLALLPAAAQDTPVTAKAARETRLRLQLISTRAAANFRSAESIENRLQQEGMSLHPQLTALRMRIEAALEDTRDELETGNLREANESLDRAQAWLDRFARRLGGD